MNANNFKQFVITTFLVGLKQKYNSKSTICKMLPRSRSSKIFQRREMPQFKGTHTHVEFRFLDYAGNFSYPEIN